MDCLINCKWPSIYAQNYKCQCNSSQVSSYNFYVVIFSPFPLINVFFYFVLVPHHSSLLFSYSAIPVKLFVLLQNWIALLVLALVFSSGIEGQESKALVTVCLHQNRLKKLKVFIYIYELKTKTSWSHLFWCRLNFVYVFLILIHCQCSLPECKVPWIIILQAHHDNLPHIVGVKMKWLTRCLWSTVSGHCRRLIKWQELHFKLK